MKKFLAILCSMQLMLGFNLLYALPSGASVQSGTAVLDATIANQLTVTNSNGAIIHWQDFSIGAAELTNFAQPSVTSSVLNRVVGGNMSQIYGTLSSNGNVILINPHGVLVGATGMINTAGFTASTLDVTNEQFQSYVAGTSGLNFVGASAVSVTNLGTITASSGDVMLVARNVDNAGAISAANGKVGLYAGQDVFIPISGSAFIKAGTAVTEEGTGVDNSGTINAAQAELSAAGGNVYAMAINNSGSVRATGTELVDGVVYFNSNGGDITNTETSVISATNEDGSGGHIKLHGYSENSIESTILNSGLIDASGISGGIVEVLADRVGLIAEGKIDASGSETDGGKVYFGGDYLGQNPEEYYNAKRAAITKDAIINADAGLEGTGGRVIVWSDEVTNFYGHISAKGGSVSGDGGFIETSSKDNLQAFGSGDATAVNGEEGTWLLDPNNVTIASGPPDTNVNQSPPGVFVTTNDSAIIHVSSIIGSLNLGTNVIVTTGTAGTNGQTGNIVVSTNVYMSGNSAATLTLDAAGDIIINNEIRAGWSGGTGAMTLNLNADFDGDNIGGVQIRGDIITNGGALNISGAAGITFVESVDIQGVNIGTQGGDISVNADGGATAFLLLGGATMDSAGGNVVVVATNSSAGDAIHIGPGGTSIVSGGGIITLDGGNAGSGNGIYLGNATTQIGNAGTGGNITFISDKFESLGAIIDTSGEVSFQAPNAGTMISVGDGVPDVGLHLDVSTELAGLTSRVSHLKIGNASMTGSMEVDGVILAHDVTLAAGGNININGSVNGNVAGAHDLIIDAANGNLNLNINGHVGATNALNNITLQNVNDLNIDGAASLYATGNVDVTTAGHTLINGTVSVGLNLDVTSGADIVENGTVGVGGNLTLLSTGGHINFDDGANNFTGIVTMTASAGDILYVNSGNIDLKTLSASGIIGLDTGANVVQTGAVTLVDELHILQAADVLLNSYSNNFGGALHLVNVTNNAFIDGSGGALDFGPSTVLGNLDLTAGTTLTQTFGDINVGGTTAVAANSIDLSDINNVFSGTVTMTALGGNADIHNNGVLNLAASNVAGTLIASTNGQDINDVGALNVSGGATFDLGGGILNLDDAANTIGGAISANNVTNMSIINNQATDLGAINVGNNLSIVSNGNLTDSGNVIVGNDFNIDVGAFDATLDSGGNSAGGNLNVTNGANVSIDTVGPTNIGNAIVSGDFTLNATGNITQTANVNIGNNASFDAGGNNILLNNNLNIVTGTLSVNNVNDATIHAGATIDFANSNVSNNLNVFSNNNDINQSGTLTVAGNTHLDAASSNIGLAGANDFGGDVSVGNALNVAVGDINTLNLGAVNASSQVIATAAGAININTGGVSAGSTLDLTAGGAINQTDVLVVTGTTTLDSGVNDINLNSGNSLNGVIDVTNGGNVSINNTAATDLGTTNTSGNLTVTSNAAVDILGTQTVGGDLTISNNGTITDTGGGVVNVTGDTIINAGGANNVTLDNASNTFGTNVGLNGVNDVTIVANSAVSLSASNVGGNLDITTNNNNIVDSSNIVVTGNTVLDAGTGDVTLLASHDFNGSVTVTNSNHTDINDINAIDFAGVTASGNLTVSAGDNVNFNIGGASIGNTLDVTASNNITQASAISVGGGTLLDAGGTNINLTAANSFSGAINIANANDANINDTTATTIIGNQTVSNDINVTASGALDIQGTVNAGNDLVLNANGNITDTGGSVTVAGNTLLDATGSDIVLDAVNTFGGTVTVTNTNNTTLNAGSALDIAGVTTTGNFTVSSGDNVNFNVGAANIGTNLDVTAANNITQATALTVGGTTTLDAGGTNINLTAANSFSGAIDIANTNDANINDTSATTTLGNQLVSNNLNVTSSGAIDVTGTVSVTSDASLAATGNITDTGGSVTVGGNTYLDASGNDVILDNGINIFTGDVQITNTNNVTIHANANLNLGASSVGNNLTLNVTNANLQDNGALSVGGNTTVDVGTGNVTLDDLSNNFAGAFRVDNASQVTVQTSNALTTDLINTTSNIVIETPTLVANGAVQTSGGNISVTTDTIDVNNAVQATGGIITFKTLSAGRVMNVGDNAAATDFSFDGTELGHIVNDYSSLVFGDISNTAGVVLAGFSGVNNLTVNTSGGITQTDTLYLTGTTVLNANSSDINLSGFQNDIDNLTIANANNADIEVGNQLDFVGASTVSGNLNLIPNGYTVSDASGSINAGSITEVLDPEGGQSTLSLNNANVGVSTTILHNGVEATLNPSTNQFVTSGGAIIGIYEGSTLILESGGKFTSGDTLIAVQNPSNPGELWTPSLNNGVTVFSINGGPILGMLNGDSVLALSQDVFRDSGNSIVAILNSDTVLLKDSQNAFVLNGNYVGIVDPADAATLILKDANNDFVNSSGVVVAFIDASGNLVFGERPVVTEPVIQPEEVLVFEVNDGTTPLPETPDVGNDDITVGGSADDSGVTATEGEGDGSGDGSTGSETEGDGTDSADEEPAQDEQTDEEQTQEEQTDEEQTEEENTSTTETETTTDNEPVEETPLSAGQTFAFDDAGPPPADVQQSLDDVTSVETKGELADALGGDGFGDGGNVDESGVDSVADDSGSQGVGPDGDGAPGQENDSSAPGNSEDTPASENSQGEGGDSTENQSSDGETQDDQSTGSESESNDDSSTTDEQDDSQEESEGTGDANADTGSGSPETPVEMTLNPGETLNLGGSGPPPLDVSIALDGVLDDVTRSELANATQ